MGEGKVEAVNLTRRRGEAEQDADFLRRPEMPVKGVADCSPGGSSKAWWQKEAERSKSDYRDSVD